MFEAIFDDFSLNLYKIDRDLKFLCFLPVCSHACPLHMCIHACTHAWGSPPTPLPPQKIWGPNPIGSWDMAHYVIGCKTSNFLIKVWGGGGGVCVWHQTPPPPPLNFNLTLSPKRFSWSLGVVVGGGGSGTRHPPPPPPPQTLTRKFSKSKELS